MMHTKTHFCAAAAATFLLTAELHALAAPRQAVSPSASPLPTAPDAQRNAEMPPPGLPEASRAAPPSVPPVVHDGVLYEAMTDHDVPDLDPQTTYLVARDAATRRPLWTVALYRIELIPHLETDVQDVFLTSLKLSADGKRLLVDDEAGRHFVVDIATRSAHQEDVHNP